MAFSPSALLHAIDKKRPHVFMPARARFLVRNTGRNQDSLDQDGFWAGRDAAAPRKRLGRIFAAGAAVITNLPVPAFAADLAAGTWPAYSVSLPAFTWTGLYLGANAAAWFAPANPSYDAIGFPSAGFDLVPNGGGTEQIEAEANQLAGPVA